jgi:hypothetical protein
LQYNPFSSLENEKQRERSRKHQDSAIYSQTSVSVAKIPEGYTTDRNPVLYPNRNPHVSLYPGFFPHSDMRLIGI